MTEPGQTDLGIPGVEGAVEVARGGFATVYRARQTLLDRVVAVKLIHGTVVDPLGGERFLREVRAAGRLSQHPNVAPIYDVGTTIARQPYLIMPFYPSGSLARRIEGGHGLSEPEAVRIGRTLANTLAYVHSHGVLHRDVKPANVLMSDADEPLLCDFGVARLTDSTVAMHTTGTSVVTWAYGPPEAFTGGDPTPAWDIYSLGATMYALLTGRPPFVEGHDVNVFTVLNRIGNVDVPDLRERGVSAPVAEAVRRAMSKAPEDRPASAAEFAEMLGRRPVAAAPRAEPEPGIAPAPAGELPPRSAPDPPRVHPDPPPRAPVPQSPAPAFHAVVTVPQAEPPAVERASPGVGDFAPPEVPPPPQPEHREHGPPRGRVSRPAVAALALAVAGAVVNLNGAGKPYLGSESKNLFSGPGWFDLQIWFPSAVLLAAVLLSPMPRLAAEWIVGAGLAYLALDYPRLTELAVRLDIAWTSFAWRTSGAALVLIAVIVAWIAGEQGGRRQSPAHALAVLGGGALAAYGASELTRRTAEWTGVPRLNSVVFASVVAVMLLAVRMVACRRRTTAAAALVAAGISGTIYWVAEAGQISTLDEPWGGDARWAAAGWAVIGALGAARWIRAATR